MWRIFDETPFERQMAAQDISADEVFALIDYPAYFDMTDFLLPEDRRGILIRLEKGFIVVEGDRGS